MYKNSINNIHLNIYENKIYIYIFIINKRKIQFKKNSKQIKNKIINYKKKQKIHISMFFFNYLNQGKFYKCFPNLKPE